MRRSTVLESTQRTSPRSIVVVLLLSLVSVAQADTVHLKDGRVLKGETKWTPGGLEIKLPMGTLVVPKRDVLRVEKEETPRQEYERRLKSLDGGNHGRAVELAVFCVKNNLEEEAAALLLQVVARDPEQKKAVDVLRGKLDYHRIAGRWVPPEDYYPARGFAKVKGRWVSRAKVLVTSAGKLEEAASGFEQALSANHFDKAAAAAKRLGAATKNLKSALVGLKPKPGDRDQLNGLVKALVATEKVVRRASREVSKKISSWEKMVAEIAKRKRLSEPPLALDKVLSRRLKISLRKLKPTDKALAKARRDLDVILHILKLVGIEPPAPPRLEIVEIDASPTEKNSTWWRWAWKLTVKNNSKSALAFDATIEFLDSGGFVVDDDREYGLVVPAGEEKVFTGFDLVTAEVAGKVKAVKAKTKIK